MTAPQFVAASLRDLREDLLSLNLVDVAWVFSEVDQSFDIRCADVGGMDAQDHLASVLDEVCDRTPPQGIFHRVTHRGQVAATGGLRGPSQEVAEVERICVRPDGRGAKLGERLMERRQADAAEFGCRRVCLETAP